MVGTQKEHRQNFQLAAKSAKVASELTCLADSTDQEWQVTAKGNRLVSKQLQFLDLLSIFRWKKMHP